MTANRAIHCRWDHWPAQSSNCANVAAVIVRRSDASTRPEASSATAVNEFLCGSIPILITTNLSVADNKPATGTLTSSRSMPLSSHAAGGRQLVARYR